MNPPLRSWLFVPGDSERKLAKALSSGADALVLDLEDSVAPSRKRLARNLIADFLKEHAAGGSPRFWVRINPLSSEWANPDLVSIVAPGLAGIVLPKCAGPGDVARLGYQLDVLEIAAGTEAGRVGILPVATETAQAPFALGDYAPARLPRLSGLTWGAEDLSTAVGASTNRGRNGEWALTYQVVRSFCLLAAKACAVQAVETLFADFKDEAGLRRDSGEARREGFTGRFAIHPDQVQPINEGFMPDPDDIAFAENVVKLFEQSPESGTLALDGRMLDIPHLNQARHVLSLRDAFAK